MENRLDDPAWSGESMTARMVVVIVVTALLALVGLWSTSPAHGEQDPAAGIVPGDHHLTWHKTASMKRQLGGRILVVDIRRGGAAAGQSIFDAHVPFVERDADENGQMVFRTDFTMRMDDALRGAKLDHSRPVILVCEDHMCGELAAVLLQEYGYERVYVVADPQAAPRALS